MTGAEYRKKRESVRLNQTQLAQALGVSRRTIVRIENSDEVATSDEFAINWLVGTMISMATDAR